MSAHVPPANISPVVIRFGRLGDTLLLQPLLHRLHQRYGRPCDLIAVGAWPEPLYQGQPDVGRIYSLKVCHRGLLVSPERWRLIWALRGMRQRPIYIAEPQPCALAKINRLLWLAGIPDAQRCYLTAMKSLPLHEADKQSAFADATPAAWQGRVGPAPAAPAAPRLQLSAQALSEARHWLADKCVQPSQLVLVQPANKRTMRWNGVRAAADDEKAWPIEHWAALARGLRAIRPELTVMFCGADVEAGYVNSIVAAAGDARICSAAGELPLSRLLAVQAMAHSMISVDTGPAHLAAAVNCPLLVLFASLAPAQWCPRSPAGSPVQTLGGVGRVRRVDELSVAEVLHAWRNLIHSCTGATSPAQVIKLKTPKSGLAGVGSD